jgi:uncharacterized LabA/DUF88 family protein
VSPKAQRGDVAVRYADLLHRLREGAEQGSGLPLLRVYWYDGAIDGVPTTEQQQIGALPDVKLRLGRISGGRQKGVDALVYRDLSVLARERAIVTAFLLAGDEDLREGLATAQELGVHVTLWGLGEPRNQALTLVAEADRRERLDNVADLFTPAPGSQLALAQGPAPTAAREPDEAEVATTASGFASTWAQRATAEEVGELLASQPHIPAALDAELLRAVQAEHGNLRGRDQLRRLVRAAFWEGVQASARRP